MKTAVDYPAAKAAYEAAQAAYLERKHPAWAKRVIEHVWGNPDAGDAKVLQQQAELLIDAMSKFEKATEGRRGHATATMAAVIAHYYGPAYVLETKWYSDVMRMAEVERKLDAELDRGEVDALYDAMLHAKLDAETMAQVPAEEAA